mmetsp:Transcript_30492/g.86012  ORF Transcript_30492/g.86012 Transcript_30492/m.86012 type:complete len:208 (-) Transcript_30492:117-740(-)
MTAGLPSVSPERDIAMTENSIHAFFMAEPPPGRLTGARTEPRRGAKQISLSLWLRTWYKGMCKGSNPLGFCWVCSIKSNEERFRTFGRIWPFFVRPQSSTNEIWSDHDLGFPSVTCSILKRHAVLTATMQLYPTRNDDGLVPSSSNLCSRSPSSKVFARRRPERGAALPVSSSESTSPRSSVRGRSRPPFGGSLICACREVLSSPPL